VYRLRLGNDLLFGIRGQGWMSHWAVENARRSLVVGPPFGSAQAGPFNEWATQNSCYVKGAPPTTADSVKSLRDLVNAD
jgi:hypothetical protein